MLVPDVQEQVRHVATVAGLPIVHVAGPGIRFAGASATSAGAADIPQDAVVLEHSVGDVSVATFEALLHVGSYSTYYQEPDAGPAVHIARLGDNSPEILVRTIEPGRRYRVSYGSIPDRPVLFRGAEMSAYALALAARRRGVMAHGCGVVLPDGKVALCLGMSGAGKSTLARMMRSLDGCRVLNDDRIVLTREDSGVHAWTTPWPGSAGIAEAGHGSLGVLALIARGEVPAVRRLSGREALPRLLQTILVPAWDGDAAGDGLAFIDDLCASVPMVELAYPLGDGVPKAIRDLLVGVTRGR